MRGEYGMAEALVSVVVPVYNAQGTLEACLNSIFTQSWRNLEVLAVDDGSTDGSLALLRKIAEKEPRLRVLAQANSGVAKARNRAISQARGAYIQFADSDDVLLPTATERMARAMEQPECDLVIAPYVETVGKIKTVRGFIREDGTLSRDAFLARLTEYPNSFFYAVMWNKLYRRENIIENDVFCDPAVHWGEDFAFNTLYYRTLHGVATLAEPVYAYTRNPRGLTFGSVWYCVCHPILSIRLKLRLQAYYDQLFRDVGLYDVYRRVLRRYLFGVTLNR